MWSFGSHVVSWLHLMLLNVHNMSLDLTLFCTMDACSLTARWNGPIAVCLRFLFRDRARLFLCVSQGNLLLTGDKDQLVMLLDQINTPFVRSNPSVLQGLLRIIPYLSFGEHEKMHILVERFKPCCSFDKYARLLRTLFSPSTLCFFLFFCFGFLFGFCVLLLLCVRVFHIFLWACCLYLPMLWIGQWREKDGLDLGN